MIDQSFLFCEIANPTNNLVYKSWVKKLSSGSCHGLENLGELCITETSLRRTLHHPGHDKRQDRNMMVKLALLSLEWYCCYCCCFSSCCYVDPVLFFTTPY